LNSLINNILPKIQANLSGAADALMLDLEGTFFFFTHEQSQDSFFNVTSFFCVAIICIGYVSETNATNIFLVDDGILLTPSADHCLPGITRATVLDLAKELQIATEVRRISLAEFHSADEVFTTGTMGELTPVTMIDGRIIGSGMCGPMTKQLQDLYQTLPDRGEPWATSIPDYE
jgi:protein-lysine N-methyltransferase EEF2KMT